ncbi:CHASE domain-containing protein [Verrucomicrobiales bacterium BCK34]|nr:CHASE domain-containing protein [Verrucomicrobiales bacterium BCK34]
MASDKQLLDDTDHPVILRWITPLTVAVFGAIVFAGIAFAVFRAESQFETARFKTLSDEIGSSIEDRMFTYIQVLRGGIGLFSASEEVRRDEFTEYFEGLRILESYPGLQGVGYARILQPGDIPGYTERIRAEGFPKFKVWPDTDFELRSSIEFLEPFDERNQRAFGFDMLSESVRRAAILRAIETGDPVVSGKVTLVQETDSDVQAGFLAYLPYYTKGDKGPEIEGLVYSPFRMNNLINSILSSKVKDQASLEIFDGAVPKPELLMYRSDPREAGGSRGRAHSESISVELPGCLWTIEVRANASFYSGFEHLASTIILFAGFIITLFGCAIVKSLRSTQSKAISLADAMTHELRESKTKVEELVESLEARVKQRTERLASINDELESFSYSVSHDLRNPLRIIEGFSSVLKEKYEDALDEDGKKLLSRIIAATVRMDHLIQDMLKLSKITRATLERKPIDLSEMANSVLSDLKAIDTDHNADVKIAPNLTCLGDRIMMRSVLQNILQNAWKYSHKVAEPEIEFGEDRTREELTFYVKDNGVGFPSEQAEQAFQPFSRMHSSKDFEGSGIGLATVRRIIQRHGGKIWIETAPDEGTTVFFTVG